MNEKERAFVNAAELLQEKFYDLTGNADAFNYNRIGEFLTAIALGLDWNSGFNSSDAFDKAGNPIEFKSTTNKNINGTYNGLSASETEDEFIDYMHQKYPDNTRHIFTRKENGIAVEIWELKNKDVLDILIPKVLNRFYPDGVYSVINKKTGKPRKDARPGSNVCMTEIKKYGERIELHRE